MKVTIPFQWAMTASTVASALQFANSRHCDTIRVGMYCNKVLSMTSRPHYTDRNRDLKRHSYVVSLDQSGADIVKATSSPIASMLSFMKVLWDFTRPHTIVGSGISVIALYLFGSPSGMWGTGKFFSSLSSSILPALLMNIYITGLNQITDVEIDKINKPYLPIAAGELSKQHGIIVVLVSLIASLQLVRNAAWPLQSVVLGSCILGTLYSLPPFRLKRFPALAAFCILVVRGSLVNMGFFLQAKSQLMGEALPSLGYACRMFPESILLTAFFAIFGIVIALMKDVPDVQGDKMFSIPSFSVKLGAAKMFRFVTFCIFFIQDGNIYGENSYMSLTALMLYFFLF